MKPITLERLQSLAAANPSATSQGEEQREDHEITEPLLRNGMSDDFRAFVDDEKQIESVLSESLELLD